MKTRPVREDAEALRRALEARMGQTVPHAELMAVLGDRAHRYGEAMHVLRGRLGVPRFSKVGRLRSIKGVGYVLMPKETT